VNPFTPKAYFNVEAFEKSTGYGVRFLDNVLDRTRYPIPEIAEQALKYRRVGLGITGLGDMLVMMNMKYGSTKAVDFTDGIMRLMRDISYETSADLANEKGAFIAYNEEFLYGGFVQKLPQSVLQKIAQYGIRNAYLGTVAPTGTTSLSLGNNCSSGVEPIFALKYQRSYRTGNSIDEKATETVYNNAYLDYVKIHGADAPIPESFVTSNDLSIDDHISMQAVVQKYIDQSVSKTITLPTGSNKEDMKDVYFKAWEMGLKGCTVFNPDGKLSPILFTEDKKTTENLTERPKILPAKVHEFTHLKKKYYALVGLTTETSIPYEVFVIQHVEENYRKWVGEFSIVREGSDHYALYYNGEMLLDKITEEFGYADEAPFTCLVVSALMRKGTSMDEIVDTLNKKTLATSFPKALGRVLKNYVEETDGEVHCPECDSVMNRVEGCYMCQNCGYGKCS
jgi:ribonucleoside-diphosphate reductase alpha chain